MTRYQVKLIGTTWEQRTSAYTYSFNFLPDFDDIRRSAGDFSDITDYSIEAITRVDTDAGYVMEFTLIRDWKQDSSQELWAEFTGH